MGGSAAAALTPPAALEIIQAVAEPLKFEVALLALALACACSQPSNTQVSGPDCLGNACGKSSTTRVGGIGGGGSSGSSASTATNSTAASSGSSSTGGSSSTSSSSGGGSSSGSGLPDLLACPTGFHPDCAAPICSTVYDYGDGSAKPGVLLTLMTPGGVPLSGTESQYTSLSDGSFFLCAPVNTPFFVQATLADYQNSDSPILSEPGGPDSFFGYYATFAVISDSDLSAFGYVLSSPPLVTGTSMIIVLVSGNGLTGCDDSSGYTVSAALPDGGKLPDGGGLPFNVTYINGDFPDSSLTATTDAGTAILYNIDSTLTNGAVIVTATNPNVPANCLQPSFAAWDMTGLVPVSESSFSETGVPLPQ